MGHPPITSHAHRSSIVGKCGHEITVEVCQLYSMTMTEKEPD